MVSKIIGASCNTGYLQNNDKTQFHKYLIPVLMFSNCGIPRKITNPPTETNRLNGTKDYGDWTV